jgi:hypothetical protein
MTEMDPIEIADGDHGPLKRSGNFIQIVDDFHGLVQPVSFA